MGTEHDRAEALRWLHQSEDDLSAATILGKNGKFAQSCFLCQQAAEKAMKAVWFLHGDDPWGHSVLRLIDELEDPNVKLQFSAHRDAAMQLDRMYIPTRYPNGLPELLPKQAYGEVDANAAASASEAIIGAVRLLLKT